MDKIMSDETISAYSAVLNDRLNQMAVEHNGKISTLSALFSDISAYTPPPSIYETMSALSASAFLSDNTLSPNLYETASALFSDISAYTPPPNFYEGIASHSALLFSLFDIVSNDINLLEESILLELDCDKKELFKAHKNLILDALFYASEDYETLLESEKQLMSHGGFIIDLLDGETVKINSVPVLIPLSGDMIKKFISIAKIFYKHLNHDENIDPSILTNQQMEEFTDQQKKEFFVYSYSLIKYLFPKATANLHPMKIEEVSTFEMLETLREWVENNCGDLLPYFKHFKQHEETGEGYNVELFQVYSVIASIGFGVKLLTGKYGNRWDTVINGVKASRIEHLRWGTVPDIIENAYQFSITYQPNKINQILIKLLLNMGVSRRAILNLPIQQDRKRTAKEFENITLPLLPITLEA
ncbi:MAG: hypothetical protein NTY39_12655 [Campylobacterales bacterium]|nr:hypothetical protein [Campylobacterales bacterium]